MWVQVPHSAPNLGKHTKVFVVMFPMVDINKRAVSELFDQNLGARQIAKQLGYKHHVSVSKCLKKLGKTRAPECVAEISSLSLDLKKNESKLRIAAEHYAKFFFTLYGYNISVPEVGSPYDLLVEIDGNFQKIQVKTATSKSHDNYGFSLRRTRNNTSVSRVVFYTHEECDWFFLLDVNLNAWLIPFNLLKGMGSVTPQKRFPGYQIKL